MNLFYRSTDDRIDCCGIRKVEPLGRALATVDGWITGVRRDQSDQRSDTGKFEIDARNRGIWKVAPLADWTREQVWTYIRERDVPYNALHDEGYTSVGCAPCTRPVGLGEDERAGRWWWERSSDRECGIHFDPRALAPESRTS